MVLSHFFLFFKDALIMLRQTRASSLTRRKTHTSTPPEPDCLFEGWKNGVLLCARSSRSALPTWQKREAPRRENKVESSHEATQKKKIRRRNAFLSLCYFFFLHESNPSTMLLPPLLGGVKKRHLALPAVVVNISISFPWWLSTKLRLLRAGRGCLSRGGSRVRGCAAFMLTLVLVLPAAVSQSDMAADRVVSKDDGEKLAKVKVRRLQSCRRQHLFSRAFLLPGVRRPVHGDQRKDGSQRGAGLPRHRKVSPRLCTFQKRRTISDQEHFWWPPFKGSHFNPENHRGKAPGRIPGSSSCLA